MNTVVNSTTKKLIWPDYHVWYANTPKLRNLVGTNPVHIVPVDNNRFKSCKTIEISNTKANNYKFGIIDVRTKQAKSIISGTMQDIDNGFVHVNKRSKFEESIVSAAISNITSMMIIDRTITSDKLAAEGKSVKLGKDVTLDQLLNKTMFDQCSRIAAVVTTLISNSFGYQIIDNQRNNAIASVFGYDPTVSFYIVNKQYLTGSTGLSSDKSTIQHFNDNVIATAISNLRFSNRDLFAVKFAKSITKNRADVVIENVTRNRLPTADNSRTFQLNIAADFQSFDINYKTSKLTMLIDGTGLKAMLTHNKKTVNLSSTTISTVCHMTNNTLLENYVDHLDVMRNDLQPVYKTFANNVIFDNMPALLETVVDKYPDIEQQQDKDNGFTLIRNLSALANNIDRFGVDVLFEYMYNNNSITNTCNNHIIVS